MQNDPVREFESLWKQASAAIGDAAAVVALATATPSGRPSVRMVLYRGIRENGFSFFTNYDSRKGNELEENPFAALAFYWDPLGKQIRIEGKVTRLSKEESDRYFASRPLESRVSAAVSLQSRPLTDEPAFISGWNEMLRSADGSTFLRPDNWGGYKILPHRMEFWTRGEYRRHHRVAYEKRGDSWQVTQLYP